MRHRFRVFQSRGANITRIGRSYDGARRGENEPGNARRCASRTLLQRSSSRSVPMGSLQAGAVPRAPVGRGLQELDERVADDGDAEGR